MPSQPGFDNPGGDGYLRERAYMRFRASRFLQVFLVLFCLAIFPDTGRSADSRDAAHAVFFKDVRARLLTEGFNQTLAAYPALQVVTREPANFDRQTARQKP